MPIPPLVPVALLAVALPAPALTPSDDPPPSRILIAADEAVGEATALTCSLTVQPIGATALDQPRLEVDLRAIQADAAWRFLITGHAISADGLTRRPISIEVSPDGARVIDSEHQRVLTADAEAAASLLGEQGVFPAIFWIAMWDALITAQLEDAGSDLPMAYAGLRQVDGRNCHAVRVDYTRQRRDLGGVYDVWWFIDQATNLPARIEACYFRRDQNAYGFNVISISNLTLNPDLSDADLALQAPAGYTQEAYQQPDLAGADMAGPTVGSAAPAWSLKDPQGVQHSLADYRGQIVVMDFWATWCGPCLAAMPGLQTLHEEFAKEPVHVVGLNAWESEDSAAYMASKEYTYALLLDASEVAEQSYQVEGIPAIFVVGPDGKIIFRAGGFSPDLEAKLRGAIERALPAAREAMKQREQAAEATPGANTGG